MFDYACSDTPDLMPAPIWLAHRLTKRLAQACRGGEVEGLCPGGKTQVTLTHEEGRPVTIDTVLISTQHDEALSDRALTDLVTSKAITPVLDEYGLELVRADMSTLVNSLGCFVIGGPAGDADPTGRKIIVDTYGGMARHGGGAFSGKDPSKVDRSAAHAARWAAKNAAAARLASRCEPQPAHVIGRAHSVGLYVDTFGAGTVENHRITDVIIEVFNLRPAGMIEDSDLLRPIYKEASAYGHFGRGLLPWEALDRVGALKTAIG